MAACSSESSPARGTAVTETIGTTGGSISAAGARLVVPAGSLSAAQALTLTPLAANGVNAALPGGTSYAGSPVSFTPDGTTFAAPVTVSIAVTDGADAVLRLDSDTATTWESVPGVQLTGGFATFPTSHFCIYAPVRTGGSRGASSSGAASSSSVGKLSPSTSMGELGHGDLKQLGKLRRIQLKQLQHVRRLSSTSASSSGEPTSNSASSSGESSSSRSGELGGVQLE